MVGVAQAGCQGSSGEPGHSHHSLGSHVDLGKLSAPVAVPSSSRLSCPLKKKNHLCYQETKELEQMLLSLKGNGQGIGVWLGVADR